MADTSWYPAEYYIQPHYASYPTINYWDKEDFAGRRRKYWNHAWRRALQRWDPAGLNLVFHPGPLGCVDHGLTAEIFHSPPGVGAWTQYNPPPECGFIQVDINVWRNALRSRFIGYLTEVLTHEVGHSLGFGHGGNGIMGPGPNKTGWPNNEEFAAARAYWHT